MATTLHSPPPTKVPKSGNLRRLKQREPGVPSTGIWVLLAAITMMFAAFTSAMVVRQGSANDWRHFAFPTILYFNTLVLVASSITLHLARRRFGHRIGISRVFVSNSCGCNFLVRPWRIGPD